MKYVILKYFILITLIEGFSHMVLKAVATHQIDFMQAGFVLLMINLFLVLLILHDKYTNDKKQESSKNIPVCGQARTVQEDSCKLYPNIQRGDSYEGSE